MREKEFYRLGFEVLSGQPTTDRDVDSEAQVEIAEKRLSV